MFKHSMMMLLFVSISFSPSEATAAGRTGCLDAVPTKNELSKYSSADKDDRFAKRMDRNCSKLNDAELNKSFGYENLCRETYEKIMNVASEYTAKYQAAVSKIQATCSSCTVPSANPSASSSESQKAYFKCLIKMENEVQAELDKLNSALKTAKEEIAKLRDYNKEVADKYAADKQKIDEAISLANSEAIEKQNQVEKMKNNPLLEKTSERIEQEASTIANKTETASSVTGTTLLTSQSGEVPAQNGGQATVKAYSDIAMALVSYQKSAAQDAQQSQSDIDTTVKNNQAKIADSNQREAYYQKALTDLGNASGSSKLATSDEAKPPVGSNAGKTSVAPSQEDSGSGLGGGSSGGGGGGDSAGDPVANSPKGGSGAMGGLGQLAQGAAGAAGAFNQGQGGGEAVSGAGNAPFMSATASGSNAINNKNTSTASKLGLNNPGSGNTTAIGADSANAISFGPSASLSRNKKKSGRTTGASMMPATTGVSGADSNSAFSSKEMPRGPATAGPLSGKGQVADSMDGNLGSSDMNLSSFDAGSTDMSDLLGGDEKKIGANSLGVLSEDERAALGLNDSEKQILADNSALLGSEDEPLFTRTRAASMRALKRGWVMDNLHMKTVFK